MAIIPQTEMFSWNQVDASSDMDRLRAVLHSIPDEALMRSLEAQRKARRNDYPIRPIWNSLLAGIVFEHVGVESLRRELSRNAELRAVCGFDVFKGQNAIPPSYVYSRFFDKLFEHHELIDSMFDELVDTLGQLLTDFGVRLAVDSKAIDSHGRPTKNSEPDRRRDTDADWGVKSYSGVRKDGSAWEKIKRWFGYKIHLIVDADYELPVAYEVTKASTSDCTELLPLLEKLDEKHPEFLEQTKFLSADKGYDSQTNNRACWDTYRVKPIIDIRSTWKEQPDMPRQLFPERVDTIAYTEDGRVLCRCRHSKNETENYDAMVYEGFESERECLKYRCPCKAKGIQCAEYEFCNEGKHTEHGRIIRVPLDKNRRTFTPQARDSKTWRREYKKRTSVERVNSRLDVSFGFERHYIRGMKKMRLRCGLALVVMLSMAVGWIKAGEQERLRSLVGTRAA
jgi:hypothetical protein